MSHSPSSILRRRHAQVASVAGLAVAGLLLAGCAGGTTETAAPSDAGDCGNYTGSLPSDPDGVVAALPADTQAEYQEYPSEVLASAWADYEGSEEPFSLGLTSLPATNAYVNNAIELLQQLASESADDGVTDEDVQIAVLPDPATMSPAEQLAQYNQLVADGVDGILLIPLSGDAMADAVTAAGEAGIVTVSVNTYVPSPYAINVQANQGQHIVQTTAPLLKAIGGQGNILVVNGFPGETNTVASSDTLQKMLADCPNIKIAGEVVGQYAPASAKAAVQQFLASYPGDIALAWQTGVMGPGVIGAFEQVGRTVPPVNLDGIQAGDAAWWNDHIADGYETVGTITTGDMMLQLSYEVLLRTLHGEGPKLNTIVFSPPVVTADNLSDILVPGADINSSDEVAFDAPAWVASRNLDVFFTRPGN